MNDQKNKQQQPQKGDESSPGKTSQSSQPQGSQSQGSQQQTPQKGNMADTRREQPMGSDIENPDRDNDPDKKVNIDDDPEQTKKKVPNMHK